MAKYEAKECFWKLLKNGEYDPNSPWAIAANQIIREDKSIPPEYARDHVIMSWLSDGDTRPLQALLEEGIPPCKEILMQLGKMLSHDDPDPILFPYKLKIFSKKRGKTKNPENKIRDELLYNHVKEYMKKGGYEHAIATVAGKFPSINIETIRNAYDYYKKKLG